VTIYETIRSKRDGNELKAGELEFLIQGFVAGDVTDYQMSAFLMATFFMGMTRGETEALVRTMLASGETVDISSLDGPKVDKHSTGGVGDKLSFIVAPIAAAEGILIPMISGRGLGHTGGTLDKLESVPGLQTTFSPDEFRDLVEEVGMAIVSQSSEIVPADRKMYALRDVTATIECVPLIVGSILSKKLAAGLDALVLDVKVGRGAFMSSLERGRELGRCLVDTAGRLGLQATAVLTSMDAPLGRAIGNALEMIESVEVLKGQGPRDVRDTSIELAAHMIHLGGLSSDVAEARKRAVAALDSGRALEVFTRFIVAQGGDPAFIDTPSALPAARVVSDAKALGEGYIGSVDALEIGLTSVELGAGRLTTASRIDPAVGIELLVSVGDRVEVGQPVAKIHASSNPSALSAVARVVAAIDIADEPPTLRSRILGIISQKE
jgi:pyrimidine-nucleoside phosphorylase